MELMIGAGLALALLYFWLMAHWFARVVVFLLLGAVLTVIITASIGWGVYDGRALGEIVLPIAAVAFGMAWLLASLPIYYWRYVIGAAGAVTAAPHRGQQRVH